MSEISGKYKKILGDLEKGIKNPQELEFVREKFAELSMMFMDIIDRITNLTDDRIKGLEKRQEEISNRINKVQLAVNGIENDIYEDDDGYEFEIVCPYCNYEFSADIDSEKNESIKCPECHNIIELDWNQEEEYGHCSGACSSCASTCGVAEENEKYKTENQKLDDDEELKDINNEDEDM